VMDVAGVHRRSWIYGALAHPGCSSLLAMPGSSVDCRVIWLEESSRSSLTQTVRYACVPRLEKFNSGAVRNLPTYCI